MSFRNRTGVLFPRWAPAVSVTPARGLRGLSEPQRLPLWKGRNGEGGRSSEPASQAVGDRGCFVGFSHLLRYVPPCRNHERPVRCLLGRWHYQIPVRGESPYVPTALDLGGRHSPGVGVEGGRPGGLGWVQLAAQGQGGALMTLPGPEESPLPVRVLDFTKKVKSVTACWGEFPR